VTILLRFMPRITELLTYKFIHRLADPNAISIAMSDSSPITYTFNSDKDANSPFILGHTPKPGSSLLNPLADVPS